MKRGCTQCGECLKVCPVYGRLKREEYSPKSKRLLLEPLHEDYAQAHDQDPELDWKHIKELARLCVGCDKCRTVCARKLSTADLLADVRATHPNWTQHFWSLWIKHMGPLWPSLGMMASLVPGWATPSALHPSLDSAKAMVNRHADRPWATLAKGPDFTPDPTPVVVFQGCTAKNIRPQWKARAEDLLRRWGYEVLDGSVFGCCGGTMHTAGVYDAMRAMQDRNVEAWIALGKPKIAVFCASCHHALSAYGEPVLHGDNVAAWRDRLTPLSALLGDAQWETTDAKPVVYGYHTPCHWGTDRDAPMLEAGLTGMRRGTAPCCGMGGITQITNPGLSRQLADACIAGFPSEIDQILTSCSGCTIQLSAAAPKGVTVSHWLDVVE